MAIGERIHYFRNKRGMTQKYLGQAVGFPERSADVRLAQYETGTRTPKADLTATLASALDVSPQALAVPDIDTDIGLMHTMFALEDTLGLKIGELDGEVCLRLNKEMGLKYISLLEMFSAWLVEAQKLERGEITREEYDRWRYYYPKYDTTGQWAKVPSQEFSNAMVEAFKDKLKDR